jgi:hypothetical protein
MGSSKTPPPRPVNPISVPTVKPISIFSAKSSMPSFDKFSVPVFSVKQNQVKELRELKTGTESRFSEDIIA